MGIFTLTNKAKADLKSIGAYTQRKWGREQRRIYLKQFDEAFHLLADTPNAGTRCDFVTPGYRKFPNTSHIIFYRDITDSEIEIVRILHRRMDAESILKNL